MSLNTRPSRDIYMSERGTGPAVLFLHGAPDSADLWSGVIDRLEDRYQCFAPDLPGFGRTATPADFVASLDYLADFVDKLVETYAIPTPLNLVVMDFGATYGLSWAVKYPEKVRNIVIAGGAIYSSKYRLYTTARLLSIPLLGELIMSRMTLPAFEKLMRKDGPNLSPDYVRQNYATSFGKPAARRMMLRMYRGLHPQDLVGWEERLAALTTKVPTHVLWGDKDPFIATTFADTFGQAQVEHFPEYGHWLPVEAPEVVAQRIGTFLA